MTTTNDVTLVLQPGYERLLDGITWTRAFAPLAPEVEARISALGGRRGPSAAPSPTSVLPIVNDSIGMAPWDEVFPPEVPLGMRWVHLSTAVTAHQPLRSGVAVGTESSFRSLRPIGIGLEIGVRVVVSQDGAPVVTWDNVYLAPGRTSYGGTEVVERSGLRTTDGTIAERTTRIGLDAGRAYADAAGDSNPIHFDVEAARAAGFDRPIVHGMVTFLVAWTLVADALADGRDDAVLAGRCRFAAPMPVGEDLALTVLPTSAPSIVAVRGRCGTRRVLRSAFFEIRPDVVTPPGRFVTDPTAS